MRRLSFFHVSSCLTSFVVSASSSPTFGDKVTLCESRNTDKFTASKSISSIHLPSQKEIDDELIDPKEAQLLSIAKFPKAMSDAQIKDIFDFKDKHKDALGRSGRDANGFKKVDGPWQTWYLNTEGLFQDKHSDILNRIIDLAFEADKKNKWGLLGSNVDDVRVRVVELHNVEKGGGLPQVTHYDHGSLVTIDIMCVEKSEFVGGEFMTLEADGELNCTEFDKGDVLVFPSHKFHCIQPVKEGERAVVIVELWRGESRTCPHRCIHHLNPCHYTLAQNKIETVYLTSFPTIDPW